MAVSMSMAKQAGKMALLLPARDIFRTLSNLYYSAFMSKIPVSLP
jgi:hypothetical protein